jgi:hypothetical protein
MEDFELFVRLLLIFLVFFVAALCVFALHLARIEMRERRELERQAQIMRGFRK